jgi:hypothetical protein
MVGIDQLDQHLVLTRATPGHAARTPRRTVTLEPANMVLLRSEKVG